MHKLTITNKIKKRYLELIFKKDIFGKIKEYNFKNIETFFKCEKLKNSHKKFCEKIKNKNICQNNKCIYTILLSDKFEELITINKKTLSKSDVENLYKNFRKIWGYEIVKLLEIKACPYCNRNFVTNFDKNTTIELDHFYPISKYPYLALNIYNLIPVCHTCNHKKKEKSFKIHPFEESIDDYFTFKFSGFNVNDKLNFFDENRLKLDIDFKKENFGEWDYKKYIKDNYQNHKDIIAEILKRKEMYPDSRIDELYKEFGGRLFNSKDELIGLINCNYIDKKDINKRPLSKLTKDILEQLNY